MMESDDRRLCAATSVRLLVIDPNASHGYAAPPPVILESLTAGGAQFDSGAGRRRPPGGRIHQSGPGR
jgi:hypothetical protein